MKMKWEDLDELDTLLAGAEGHLLDAERVYNEAKDKIWRLEGGVAEAIETDINHSLDRIFGGSPEFRSLLDIAEAIRTTLSRTMGELEEEEETIAMEEGEDVDAVVSTVIERIKTGDMIKTAPPQWVVDEAIWERAKKEVDPEQAEEFYAVVTKVYKNMGGKIKSKSSIIAGIVLRRLQALKTANMIKTAPPQWAVDEDIWDDAKGAVRKYRGRYKDWYGAVTHVYKNMGGRIKHRRSKLAADIVFVHDRVVNSNMGPGTIIDMTEDPVTSTRVAQVHYDSGEIEWTLLEDVIREDVYQELEGGI